MWYQSPNQTHYIRTKRLYTLMFNIRVCIVINGEHTCLGCIVMNRDVQPTPRFLVIYHMIGVAFSKDRQQKWHMYGGTSTIKLSVYTSVSQYLGGTGHGGVLQGGPPEADHLHL